MAKLSNTREEETKRILIYGAPKRGKTHLAGTLASKYKLIWFDLESGVDTLRDLPVEQQENITLIKVTDSWNMPIAVETIITVLSQPAKSHKICDAHGKISCPVCSKDPEATHESICLAALDKDTVVVIDSLTQLDASMRALIGKDLADVQKFEFDHWEHLRKLSTKIGQSMQSAPCHLVCITHEQEVEMEDGKKMLVPVIGSSSFARSVAKFFSDVIYCDVRNKAYVAASSVGHSSMVTAGSRNGTILEGKTNKELSLLPFFERITQQVKPNATVTKANNILSGLRKPS